MIRREALAAATVYALLALAFLGQGLAPGRTLSASDLLWSAAPWSASAPARVAALGANPELADAVTVFQPFGQYVASRVPSAPLWNPFIMGGRPLLADGQSAVLSPYSVPGYVLGFWRSLEFAALLKLFVSALGTFLLARIALGQRFGGALLAGTVFAFALNMVAWLPWPLTSVWSLSPWLLLLVDRVVRHPRPAAVAGLAVAVALQYFGGHPESSFHVLALGAAFAALRLIQCVRSRGARAALGALGALVGAVALGTGLAALTLLPFVELLAHSADLAQRGHQAAVVPAKYLLGVLLSDYWGRPTQSTLAGFEVQRAFYAGALPLLLGAFALMRRRSAERLFFAAVAIVCLVGVVGGQPVAFVFAHLPGFNVAYNTRLTVFYGLGLALLAGWGLDDLCRPRCADRPPRARGPMWVALGLLAGGFAFVPLVALVAQHDLSGRRLGRALDVAWGFAKAPGGLSPGVPVVIRMAAAIVWLSFAAAAVALVALRLRRRVSARAFVALAVALAVADLFRAGMGENPAIPTAHALQPATPAIRYLQGQRPARFVGVPPSTFLASIPITPDVGMRYGLFDARGYDLPVEQRYNALWRRSVSNRPLIIPPTELAPVTAASLPALDLLGVADIVQSPTDPVLHAPGLRVVYSGRDARIYANAGAMARATLVGAARVVRRDGDALAQITRPGFDPRRVALVGKPVAGLPAAPQAASPGQAQIVDYRPEQVVLHAQVGAPALLVLNDVFYPGWKATVDGNPTQIERVDYLLRGVALGPGAHVVRMRYDPASWRAGWIVSLVSLLVVCGLLVYALASHMRTAGARYSRRS